jgi:hypothetical protein
MKFLTNSKTHINLHKDYGNDTLTERATPTFLGLQMDINLKLVKKCTTLGSACFAMMALIPLNDNAHFKISLLCIFPFH